jgi:hypothetical protein
LLTTAQLDLTVCRIPSRSPFSLALLHNSTARPDCMPHPFSLAQLHHSTARPDYMPHPFFLPSLLLCCTTAQLELTICRIPYLPLLSCSAAPLARASYPPSHLSPMPSTTSPPKVIFPISYPPTLLQVISRSFLIPGRHLSPSGAAASSCGTHDDAKATS